MSDIHALSGAYAVGAVDDLERASFERHLAGCPACRAEVASLREAAAFLADDTAAAPPPELRDAVLAGISRVRPLPPSAEPDDAGETDEAEGQAPAHRRRWFPALVAAVVLAIVGIGAVVWHPWQDDTSSTLTTAEQVLADPDAQHVTQELPNGATATVVRSPSVHRTVIVTEDLPDAPSGKDYQLWLQAPSEALVSAGLMPAGADTVLLEGDSDDAIGVGLSLEPDGGSEQPTDVLALFDLGGAA
jgi:anti-sigma-K factor RskA